MHTTVLVKVRLSDALPKSGVPLGRYTIDAFEGLIASMTEWFVSVDGESSRDISGQYVVETTGCWFEILIGESE